MSCLPGLTSYIKWLFCIGWFSYLWSYFKPVLSFWYFLPILIASISDPHSRYYLFHKLLLLMIFNDILYHLIFYRAVCVFLLGAHVLIIFTVSLGWFFSCQWNIRDLEVFSWNRYLFKHRKKLCSVFLLFPPFFLTHCGIVVIAIWNVDKLIKFNCKLI